MANAVTIQGVMTAVGLTSPTAAQLAYATFCADYAEATIKKIRNQYADAWVAETLYTRGQKVNTNGYILTCVSGGTTDATEPTIINGEIADGTVTWKKYGIDSVEAMYQPLAIQMATALYNRQGIEGAKSFAENGMSITFDSSDIPRDMIKQVIPMGSVY